MSSDAIELMVMVDGVLIELDSIIESALRSSPETTTLADTFSARRRNWSARKDEVLEQLAPDGNVWADLPDLEISSEQFRRLWTLFYQLVVSEAKETPERVEIAAVAQSYSISFFLMSIFSSVATMSKNLDSFSQEDELKVQGLSLEIVRKLRSLLGTDRIRCKLTRLEPDQLAHLKQLLAMVDQRLFEELHDYRYELRNARQSA